MSRVHFFHCFRNVLRQAYFQASGQVLSMYTRLEIAEILIFNVPMKISHLESTFRKLNKAHWRIENSFVLQLYGFHGSEGTRNDRTKFSMDEINWCLNVLIWLKKRRHIPSCVAFWTCTEVFPQRSDLVTCHSWQPYGNKEACQISWFQLPLTRHWMHWTIVKGKVVFLARSIMLCVFVCIQPAFFTCNCLAALITVCHKCTLLLKQKNVHPSGKKW